MVDCCDAVTREADAPSTAIGALPMSAQRLLTLSRLCCLAWVGVRMIVVGPRPTAMSRIPKALSVLHRSITDVKLWAEVYKDRLILAPSAADVMPTTDVRAIPRTLGEYVDCDKDAALSPYL